MQAASNKERNIEAVLNENESYKAETLVISKV